MEKLKTCRRTFICFYFGTLLFLLGWFKGVEVGTILSTMFIGLGVVNAYEKSSNNDPQETDKQL